MSHSRPYHPQTCGKVERFHQTLKKWLSKQPAAETLEDLQALLDEFALIYNDQRPHRAISRKTPADQFKEMTKAGPADRPLNTPTWTGLGLVGGSDVGVGPRFGGGLLIVEQGFVLDGRPVADGCVESMMIEPVDVFERSELDLVGVAPRPFRVD